MITPLAAGKPRDEQHQTPAQHHPHRWRLNRAGIMNVWYYYDIQFEFSGGRMILRGTNGSGKSRALEMLLPFVLDADRRKMDATGAGKVRLLDLMNAGSDGQSNRMGYLWLELIRTDEDSGEPVHLTVGALVRSAQSASEAKVWYFTTTLRVGHGLQLLSKPDRTPLSREKLTELIGADRITDSPEAHRDTVRTTVFGLTGESGRERYVGLLQLLHTLRSPDVGNRIEEGKLPQILSDALPPLSENALVAAGEQLDGLSETRAGQERLTRAHELVSTFLTTYRRYTAGVLTATSDSALRAAVNTAHAKKDAADRLAEHDDLSAKHAAAAKLLTELDTRREDLASTISGLKSSSSYTKARELNDQRQRVAALARAAETALTRASDARESEQSRVNDADGRAEEVAAAATLASTSLERARQQLHAAGAGTTLPSTVSAHLSTKPAPNATVRLDRNSDPTTAPRPTPTRLTLTPNDLPAAAHQAIKARDAVKARAEHARSRLDHARSLDRDEIKVTSAEDRASELLERAEQASADADTADTTWADEARALTQSWRDWATSAPTLETLGEDAWDASPVATVLADGDALSGEAGKELLDELDYAAETAAEPARQRHATALADLATAADIDHLQRTNLLVEQQQLHTNVVPDPARPNWLTGHPDGATPLWQAVDFADHLTAAQRAGLEGALLSSGLLLAVVDTTGELRAADGQLLVHDTNQSAITALTTVLRPDPASPLPPKVVDAVLSSIGYGAGTHPVWVDHDGSWGNGPLHGRHCPATARHVGAAARASARADRLEQIQLVLTALETAAAARTLEQVRVDGLRSALNAHLRTAPRSRSVVLAADRAVRTRQAAERDHTAARNARTQAEQSRRTWSTQLSDHQTACANFGLPHTATELGTVQQEANLAVGRCDEAARALTEVQRRATAHSAALDTAHQAAQHRDDAGQKAEQEWSTWHQAGAEFEAVRSSVGAQVKTVLAEIAQSEKALQACTDSLSSTRAQESKLTTLVATAEGSAQTAAKAVEDAQRDLEEAASRLQRHLDLPGVLAAATTHPVEVNLADVNEASVRTAAETVIAALGRFQPADENALINAQKPLDREIAASFDVISEVRDGVRLVELTDATGRKTIAAAAADLAQQQKAGQAALTERERTVFTEFVIGGVAEELRRRLSQASSLTDAMNTSLSSIKTSHGIGVKLRWALTDGAGAPVTRIRQLVSMAEAVRTPEQTRELTDLLKERVDEQFLTDASAGYAAHLQTALDYRAWHRIEVIILGPGPTQERRISRRAKLSQGETRFVSYVTLFAAVDAYLSGLPDTSRALRMLLLDDAFAKVDDRTIGELMGLLVRLDIDFAMTGHALWGTYPQVPAVDCYEVRRHEGSSAVVTHIHWDGRNRHLRAAQ